MRKRNIKTQEEKLHDEAHWNKPVEPFTRQASWKVFKILAEFIQGIEFLADLKKEVTFFGSARTKEGTKHYENARQLAFKLGKSGFTVITGGGPGIMQAANQGAKEAKAESIGLNIQLPREQRENEYITQSIGFHYFFVRKTMLSMSAHAYIFCPGGFGTLDEFFEIITLIQTNKTEKLPVVLLGEEYWKPLCNFLEKTVYKKHKSIHKEDMNLYYIARDVQDAYKYILKNSCPRKFFTTKD